MCAFQCLLVPIWCWDLRGSLPFIAEYRWFNTSFAIVMQWLLYLHIDRITHPHLDDFRAPDFCFPHTSYVTSDETSACIDGPIILLKKGWNLFFRMCIKQMKEKSHRLCRQPMPSNECVCKSKNSGVLWAYQIELYIFNALFSSWKVSHSFRNSAYFLIYSLE